MSRSSHRPSNPVYYIEDCRISSPVVIVLIYSISAIAYDVTLWLRFQKGFQSLESPTFYDLLQDCILSQTIVHFQCTVFHDSEEIIMPFKTNNIMTYKGNNCVRNYHAI